MNIVARCAVATLVAALAVSRPGEEAAGHSRAPTAAQEPLVVRVLDDVSRNRCLTPR